VTSAVISRNPSKRRSWPANMKVSPIFSPWMKFSSISPSTRPRRKRTFSIGSWTMTPTFMR
jgi:hypothetical protein